MGSGSFPFGKARNVECGNGYGSRDIEGLYVAAEGDGKSSSGLPTDLSGQTAAFITDSKDKFPWHLVNLVDRNGLVPCHFCGKDLATLPDQPRHIPGGKDRQREQHTARRTNHLGMIDIGGFWRKPQGTRIETCRRSNNGPNIGGIL